MTPQSRIASSADRDWFWIFWPSLLGAALLTAAIVWFFGPAAVDLRPILRLLLVGGVFAVLWLQWSPQLAGSQENAISGLVGVLILTLAWVEIGGLGTPVFLALFALPVFAAALASRGWLEYVVAAGAVVAAIAAAYFSSSSFRWRVDQLGYVEWLTTDKLSLANVAYEVPGDSPAAVLGPFAVTMFAVALIGSTVARRIRTLESRLSIADSARRELEDVVSRLLQQTEGFLVSPRSGRVVGGGVADLAPSDVDVIGTPLIEVLKPVYPEQLTNLLDSAKSEAEVAMPCAPRGESRLFDVAVDSIRLNDEAVRFVTIRDTASETLAAAALDQFEIGIAIIGPNGQIEFTTRAFSALFPSAVADCPASDAFKGCHDLPVGWWDIAPAHHGRVRFTVDEHSYTVTLTSPIEHRAGVLTYLRLTEDAE